VTRGRLQAKSLARELARYRPARIISSPTARCRQTVEPLAILIGQEVELSDSLAPDADRKALLLIGDLVRSEPTAASVVLCTHREVLVEIMPLLSREFGVKIGHRLPGAKGGTWTLQFRQPKLVSVKYRPPRL
jgi:8-oxo-dGTP diphosphatase